MDGRYLEALYRDGDEKIAVYQSGADVIESFAALSPICSAIFDTTIGLGVTLGKGKYGKVYEVLFPDAAPDKEYAVKSINAKVERVEYEGISMRLQDVLEQDFEMLVPLHRLMVQINGGDPGRVIHPGDDIIVPAFVYDCRTSSDRSYPSVADPEKRVVAPKGSYVCDDVTYIEYLSGALAAQLARRGICPHFVDMIDMITCQSPRGVIKQYVFMERLGDSLRDIIMYPGRYADRYKKRINFTAFVVQMAAAFASLQEHYKMVHGDAHGENIMISPLRVKADYLHYKVGDGDLYIPAPEYILKLADWGLAAKYSEPMILPEQVIKDGAPAKNSEGVEEPWIPNFFSKSYDILFFLCNFIAYGMMPPDITATLKWILGDDDIFKYIRKGIYRPRLDMLPSRGAYDYLASCPVLDRYRVKPAKGEIVHVCTVRDV